MGVVAIDGDCVSITSRMEFTSTFQGKSPCLLVFHAILCLVYANLILSNGYDNVAAAVRANCLPFYTEKISQCKAKMNKCNNLKWVSANCNRKSSLVDFRNRGCRQKDWCLYKCATECRQDKHCEWVDLYQMCFAKGGDKKRRRKAQLRHRQKPIPSPVTTPAPVDTNTAEGFVIDIVFPENTVTASIKNIALLAAQRWTEVITRGYGSEGIVEEGRRFCRYTLTRDYIVQDMLVLVLIEKIDGLNKIYASGSVCAVDEEGNPRMGVIRLDAEDLPMLETLGELGTILAHELGHTLGIGSMWESRNLISPKPIQPILYLGSQGNIGNIEIGGVSNAIVENTGGNGTARTHWKETVYSNELMTSEHDSDATLSRLTVRALEDLGYHVDVSKAENFNLDSASARVSEGNIATKSSLRKRTIRHIDDVVQEKPEIISFSPLY